MLADSNATPWADPSFVDLPTASQWLYLTLASQPDLTPAGVLPLRERRWAGYARDVTVEDINIGLKQLGQAGYVVVDHDTEEVLLPHLARATKDLTNIVSATIRSALAQISSPPERKPRTKRGTRLPQDWKPSGRLLTWAADKQVNATALTRAVDIDHETEKFCNHWWSTTGANATKLDWNRAWQNWLMNAAERNQRYHHPTTPDDRRQQETAAAIRALEKTQPPCAHGRPAGRAPHPTNGQPLCPFCRTGATPVEPDGPTTHPDIAEAICAYNNAYGPRPPSTYWLVQITQQIAGLHARGVTRAQLVDLATRAGKARTGLIKVITSQGAAS